MIKVTHLLLAGAAVFALCEAGLAQETPPRTPVENSAALDGIASAIVAQESVPAPLPTGPEYGVGAGILDALPRPRDTPCSLFAPAQAPSPGAVDLDGPYFVPDPLLDPSFFPPPGWFAGAEVQIVKPHLRPELIGSTLPGKYVPVYQNNSPIGPNATNLNIASTPLDWTASPRVFAGYRLPAGFGEFMVAYRHLGSSGSGTSPETTGPVSNFTRFAFDTIDVDYNSRQLSLGPIGI
jgi:hypothetical protein